MEVSLETISLKVMALPAPSRAALAKTLLDSLDPAVGHIEENEVAWAQEAERRFQEIKSGNAKTKPASDVMREARARFKN